ncbi:hypothetical protein tb265_48320 [Gemmatimonadetes bacterium T265]|nr:hypothetical protein tb265_48320 [Gemmatimonadetes bacterium T265]
MNGADTAQVAGGGAPPKPAGTSPAPVLLVLAACVGYAMWAGAQRAAAAYGYAPTLGQPLFAATGSATVLLRVGAVTLAGVGAAVLTRARRGPASAPSVALGCLVAAVTASVAARAPVYGPLQGVTWMVRLGRVPAGDVAREAADAAMRAYWWGFGSTLLVLLVLALVAYPRRRRRAPSASHGSATWGTGDDLRATFVPGPRLGNATGASLGLLLGRAADARGHLTLHVPRRRARRVTGTPVLHYQGDGHLVTIAPTRSGKGVSVIVPNLLVYPGSVVVTDPKGENYTLTHRRRRDAQQQVWALDPFGITDAEAHAHGVRGAINPLDIVDASAVDAPDDAAILADMLTLPEETASGTGGDSHFEPEGRALLSALILYVAATEPRGRRRSLLRVRELVTLPPDEFTKLLAKMRACGTEGSTAHLGHVGTLIARGAARLQQKADKERSGVISTAQRCTHFLDSERMAAVLAHTTVPLDYLRRGQLSLYLVLPTERLSTYRAWMRLMIGVCLRTMVHQGAGEALVGQAHGERPRVLFALDEFANLKRLAPVEDAFTIAAGYGVTFWLFLQDLAQLKAQYRQSWGTFLANADVLQTFGTNDLDTAKLVSELTGEATILVEGESASASTSHGRQGSRQEGSSQSLSEKGRRLLTPDEVRRLPPDEALVFLRSRAPLRVRKLHYARDAAFAGLYDRPGAPNRAAAVREGTDDSADRATTVEQPAADADAAGADAA